MAMDENPYAPPRATDLAVGIKSGRREDLKSLAVAQKAIMICILLQIVIGAARFVVPADYAIILGIVALLVLLASTVSMFMLAMKVFNIGSGILYALGALVPCLGLLVLLAVNQRATRILRENGYKVGLLGANLSEF